jgi:hypothetical protein
MPAGTEPEVDAEAAAQAQPDPAPVTEESIVDATQIEVLESLEPPRKLWEFLPGVHTMYYLTGKTPSVLTVVPDWWWFAILVGAVTLSLLPKAAYQPVDWGPRILLGLAAVVFGLLSGAAGYVVIWKRPFGKDTALTHFGRTMLLPLGVVATLAHIFMISIRRGGCSLERLLHWGSLVGCTVAYTPVLALFGVFWWRSAPNADNTHAQLVRRLVLAAGGILLLVALVRFIIAAVAVFSEAEFDRLYFGLSEKGTC